MLFPSSAALGYIHTAPLSVIVDIYVVPFLYRNGAKNVCFRGFILLTKTDRGHCYVFVKLHKGAKALTLLTV